ncbi:MAG: TonB-dependent receptor [Chitinophagaceae bacterium]|nr:MAG: TonB-dependent receptor [Chitinophagaceae bacterium]
MKGKFSLFLLLFFSVSFVAFGQTRQVTGRVVSDSAGAPLPGVNVTVKGSTTGTVTDVNGNFSITVPNNNTTLVFSSVGFGSQEVNVGNRSTVNVTLNSASGALDVVVIGYQSVRRKDLTGTVSSIAATQLEKIPVANVAEALTGRLPGVQVTTTDGAPGAEIVIRVRGGGSLTGSNNPLYIVDGFRVNSINDIAPSDIASIDILKDAATAAIYGAAGANGVVIVTTKSARGGKTSVALNSFVQARTLPKKLEVLSPYEFVLAQYEYARLRSQTDVDNFSKYFGVYDDLELYKTQRGTDWQDKLFGSPAISQQHSASITGGTDKTRMSLNFTNNTDQGLIEGSGYQRNYLNFKLNHEIARGLKFDFASRYTHTIIDGAGTSGGSSLRISDAINTRPVNGIADMIIVDPGSGDDYDQFLRNLINPLQLAAQDYRKRVNRVLNLNAAASWSILNNLTFRSEFGYDLGWGQSRRYYGSLTSTSRNEGGNLPLGEITQSQSNGIRWTNTLNYQWRNGTKHDLNLLVGQEALALGSGFEEYNRAKFFTEGITPRKLFATMTLGTQDRHTTTDFAGNKTASFFGRAIYQFDRKYIVNLTARYDGSTKFAPGKQWGLFPAASVAWRVSAEDFMQDVKFVNDLKFRVSYGTAGNNNIRDDQWRVLFAPTDNRPIGFGDVAQPYYTYSGSQLPNPDIQWETTITRNIGLDFSLFGNAVSGTLDFYKNTTKDLLVESAIPQTTGFSTQQRNIGQTSNRGVELGLTASLVTKKDFTLSANFNIGINRARIDALDGVNERSFNSNWAGTDLKTIDDYRLIVGQTVGLMYGYVTDGMYSVDDFSAYNATNRTYTLKPGVTNVGSFMGGISVRPGVLKLKDLDGDGTITGADRQIIGSAQPKHSGGFGLNSTFKAFDFTAFFNWVYGNQVYNTGKIAFNMLYRTTYGNMLNTSNYENRFHYIDAAGNLVTELADLAKLNPDPTIWSPFSMGTASPVFHSWAVEDGSFLRLSNISLGYTLPKSLTSKIAISRLRVYATVYNAFLWTKYSGYDPEVTATRSGSYNQLTPGVDYSAYPKSRTFTAGINVTF